MRLITYNLIERIVNDFLHKDNKKVLTKLNQGYSRPKIHEKKPKSYAAGVGVIFDIPIKFIPFQ